ncbi:hypothetical protein CA262_24105 [Sphingobium sp. GW456-12-10-14-TSB1]|nr:hypothetical protein CA262_24105 [Sphingobium sp. GW456-12-10-14-TSB1]
MENPSAAIIVTAQSVLTGWVNVSRVEVRMPDGATVERHVEDHGDGAVVLPYDPERRMALLVTQPRAAVLLAGGTAPVEAIAGRLDGETPEACALKEAWEEGGVTLKSLEFVVHLWSMPSISTERLHLFLAPYGLSTRVGSGGGCLHEHENISVHEIPLIDLARDASNGRILDAKTLILILSLKDRYPHLFTTS